MRTIAQPSRPVVVAKGPSSLHMMMEATSLLLAGLRTGNEILLLRSGTSAIEATANLYLTASRWLKSSSSTSVQGDMYCPARADGLHYVEEDDWEQAFDDELGEFMRGRCLHCGMVHTRKVDDNDALVIPEEWL